MEERMLTCPQCSHLFPMEKHAAGGVWECPSCDHKFRPATSDVANLEEVEAATQESKRDWFPLVSFVMLITFTLSVLASLTWAVPYAEYEAIAASLSLSCLSTKVFALGNLVSANYLAVWPITLMSVFFAWLFVVRFLKGALRWVFHSALVLFYLVLMGAISAAVVMASGCASSCPFSGGCF